MKCEKCEEEIPQERLEVLPDTKFCVKCSDVNTYKASMHDGQICVARTEEEKRRQGLHYT